MAGAIFANQAGTVHTEEHWLVVLTGVVDDLVPGTLQEGRVDRDHRPTAAHRNPRCGCNGVLFCDPNVIEAIWVCGGKLVEAGPRWHASGDRHNAAIIRGGGDHLGGKESCVVRSLWRRCLRNAAALSI